MSERFDRCCLLAEILVAEKARGHNDAPLFDDYSKEGQARFLEEAAWIIRVLRENGYEITPTAGSVMKGLAG